MKSLLYLFVFIGLCTQNLLAQQSLLDADPSGISYRKAVKKAKDNQAPILAVMYSEGQPTSSTNEFSGLNELITSHGYVPVVIDWYKSPNKAPQRKVDDVENQLWLFIHYDGAVFSAYKDITSNTQLEQVLTTELKLFTKVNEAYVKQEQSNRPEDILNYAHTISETYEAYLANDLVDDYLKRVDPNHMDAASLQKVIRISSSRPTTSRVYNLLRARGEQAKRVVGRDTVLDLQTSYIKRYLRNKNLLDPFNIWQRYEAELGYEADSLYLRFRRFILHMTA